MKTKWKRVERIPFKAETSVLSRLHARVYASAHAEPKGPRRARIYMYNEDEAEDKGAGMWEDAPRNCRKGDELFARRSCLPEICHGFSFRWKDLITRRETLNNAKNRVKQDILEDISFGNYATWLFFTIILAKDRRGILLIKFSKRTSRATFSFPRFLNKFIHYSIRIPYCFHYKIRFKHMCWLYVGK